jgi:hypothetical protein
MYTTYCDFLHVRFNPAQNTDVDVWQKSLDTPALYTQLYRINFYLWRGLGG